MIRTMTMMIIIIAVIIHLDSYVVPFYRSSSL